MDVCYFYLFFIIITFLQFNVYTRCKYVTGMFMLNEKSMFVGMLVFCQWASVLINARALFWLSSESEIWVTLLPPFSCTLYSWLFSLSHLPFLPYQNQPLVCNGYLKYKHIRIEKVSENLSVLCIPDNHFNDTGNFFSVGLYFSVSVFSLQ